MNNYLNQYHCNICNDEGYIYTCLNCYKPASYDSEFGVIVCNDCFLLGEKQNNISEKCSHCDIASQSYKIPNVGDTLSQPYDDSVKNVINSSFNLKIHFKDSYDVINPIDVDAGNLKYFSNVENRINHIAVSDLLTVTVYQRILSEIRWTTTLKGLSGYLKESRNRELLQKYFYVRLPLASGFSWNFPGVTEEDIINKRHLRDSHFVNGVTFKINDLLNDQNFRFDANKVLNSEFYFLCKERSQLYFIQTIQKFELF